MKPVAILRFSPEDGPGYFASFLDHHSIPWRLIKVDAGDAVPNDPENFSGFGFMGGPMSVNDPLPWIPPALALIRDAMAVNKPCIGHCLGGQLMSKALGGVVTKNPVKEIGWNPVVAENNALAREWLGETLSESARITAFQWHGETFSLPPGATRILTGEACSNQAYVMGQSLGMQCHTEMTAEMIEIWCRDWAAECVDASESVQRPEDIQRSIATNVNALRTLSDRLYARWIAGLRQGN